MTHSVDTFFVPCWFFQRRKLTHKSDFELPALAECSVERSNFASAESNLESNEALQVRLLLEHVLPDHLVVVIQPLDLVINSNFPRK